MADEEIWAEDFYDEEDIYTKEGIENLESEGSYNAGELGFMKGYIKEKEE